MNDRMRVKLPSLPVVPPLDDGPRLERPRPARVPGQVARLHPTRPVRVALNAGEPVPVDPRVPEGEMPALPNGHAVLLVPADVAPLDQCPPAAEHRHPELFRVADDAAAERRRDPVVV